MTLEPPPLAYAVPEAVDLRFERARRTFAWFALGAAIVGALNGAISGYSYWQIRQFGPGRFILPATLLVMAGPLAAGAILMLRGREGGAVVVRWSAFAVCAASFGGQLAIHLSIAGVVLPTTGLEVGRIVAVALSALVGSLLSVWSLLFCLSFPLRQGTRRTR